MRTSALLPLLTLTLAAGAARAEGLTPEQTKALVTELDERQRNSGDYKALVYLERKEKNENDLVYELVVYRLSDAAEAGLGGDVALSEDEMATYLAVPAGVTGWTPALDECFEPDTRYVWFVRAQWAGPDGELTAGDWSPGRFFATPAGVLVPVKGHGSGVALAPCARGRGLLVLGDGPCLDRRDGLDVIGRTVKRQDDEGVDGIAMFLR